MLLYVGNKLSKKGNTVTSVETLGALLALNFDIITVSDKNNKLLRLVDMLMAIVRYRKVTRYVLIDTYSTLNFYYAFLCAVLCKYLSVAFIPILHGGNLPIRLRQSPRLTAFIFNHAYINVAPSAYLQHIFQQQGFNVRYIPNTIDVNCYRYTERRSVRPKLLYVRAFSKSYNPQMALTVLQTLLTKHADAELCMVGPDRDGTLQLTKELCQTLGLVDKVTFTGKLNQQQWRKLSMDYDVFINTSDVDNTPVSVVEAMALGLPVVSTHVGGLPYLIEANVDGLLVAPNDAKAMSENIDYLILNPEIAYNLTQKARAKAEYFDWKRVSKQWLQLLEND